MSGAQFDSVWDAIEDTPQEAENMRLRSGLMMVLAERIKSEGWTQKDAAEKFGVTQPRVSDLVRGRITLFSLDALVNMVTATGMHVEITVSEMQDRNGRVASAYASGEPAIQPKRRRWVATPG